MQKLVILFTLLLLPLTGFAAAKGDFTINGIGISHKSGSIFIIVNEEVESTTCSENKRFRIPGDSKVFREMWSMLLTAQATGQPIRVSYDESDCYIDGNVVNFLYLRQQ